MTGITARGPMGVLRTSGDCMRPKTKSRPLLSIDVRNSKIKVQYSPRNNQTLGFWFIIHLSDILYYPRFD